MSNYAIDIARNVLEEEVKKLQLIEHPHTYEKQVEELFHRFNGFLKKDCFDSLENNGLFKLLFEKKYFHLLTQLSNFNEKESNAWYHCILQKIFKLDTIDEIKDYQKSLLDSFNATYNISHTLSVETIWNTMFKFCLTHKDQFNHLDNSNQHKIQLFEALFRKDSPYVHNLEQDFIIIQLFKYADQDILELFKNKGIHFLHYHQTFKDNIPELSLHTLAASLNTINEQGAITISRFLINEGIALATDEYTTYIKFVDKNYDSYVNSFFENIDFSHPNIQKYYQKLLTKDSNNINEAEKSFIQFCHYYELQNNLRDDLHPRTQHKI